MIIIIKLWCLCESCQIISAVMMMGQINTIAQDPQAWDERFPVDSDWALTNLKRLHCLNTRFEGKAARDCHQLHWSVLILI